MPKVSNCWQCTIESIDHCTQILCCFGRWRSCIFSSTTASNKARTGPDVVLLAAFESKPILNGDWKVTKWKSLLLEPCPQLPSKSIVLETIWNNLQKKHKHACVHVQRKRISRNSKNLFVSLSDWFHVMPCYAWVYVIKSDTSII